MKHNTKITIILITMFVITQLIGLFVISTYHLNGNQLPFGMEPPEKIDNPQGMGFLGTLLTAFIFAILIFFLLTKFKAEKFIRVWFFIVTTLAIGLALKAISFFIFKKDILLNNIFSFQSNISLISIIIILLALPLAYIKIFKRNLITHNLTELLIYPGIAAVFVPILGILGIILLLLVISLYDIWAVWKSKFMQKMAKYQINNLRIFTGFFVPYVNKKQKTKIRLIKQKSLKFKGKIREKFLEKQFKKSKIKVNLAILGGGDVIFPIIAAGVFYVAFQSIIPALIILVSSTIGLLSLFLMARKGKFYPAMPFITIAIYLGIILIFLMRQLNYLR
jgi:presenilin-like A22 family membrane protease